LKIDTNAKVPQVTAHMIDLADFKGVVGAKPAHSSTEKPQPEDKDHLIPDTPMAVQKLPGLNADLTFDAARIKQVSGIPFERVSLGLQLKDGVLIVKPLRFRTTGRRNRNRPRYKKVV
jgi:AsmA family protein